MNELRKIDDATIIEVLSCLSEMKGNFARITIERAETNELANKKKRFFESVKKYSFKLPPDYEFNREELYDR